MAKKKPASKLPKTVEAITHPEDKRRNIPTAELQSVMQKERETPVPVKYPRNTDLDPQLVWRGKDEQDWSDLVVHAPPIYIQEKVHPKVLIEDLLKQTQEAKVAEQKSKKEFAKSLFADFNGIPEGADKTDFYQHDQNWSNRMILGDSLQVMASLAEREGLRGKVQCIYLDPPYGIKFNSNFQWSTTSRDVKDGNTDHITREPEQVKAFRDTWRDGIHSYLTYLRDRLTVARDLLTDSGSIFVQIGDENVHRVRAVMDEVFGEENFVSEIIFQTTSSSSSEYLDIVNDYILWFAKSIESCKYRQLTSSKEGYSSTETQYRFMRESDGIFKIPKDDEEYSKLLRISEITSQTKAATTVYDYIYEGDKYTTGKRQWCTPILGMNRLSKARRIIKTGKTIGYARFFNDYPVVPIKNIWSDTGTGSGLNKLYVVQTNEKVIQRCILMATDPGDLVLDPTCGSGTTAYVAEQWGRRWITVDTSRVALALARARIMGARYPYYYLADSKEGQQKVADITRTEPSIKQVTNNIRLGFVYERVPHITLKSIANNAEIDVIWDKWQQTLEPLRKKLNTSLKKTWEEWEIPREAEAKWTADVKKLHTAWWEARIARQKEIDASIAAKAEYEYLYDKPYDDKKKVRVAGPFTVESLSPHRYLGVDADDKLIDPLKEVQKQSSEAKTFVQMILENLKLAGVQQAHKENKISFTTIKPWPGEYVCAEGVYEVERGEVKSGEERVKSKTGTNHSSLSTSHSLRAAIFIGPEFGTVQRQDLVKAALEAGDAGFDVLVSCAFNYEAHATEFNKLGRIPVLKARMNADLHMSKELKNTGKGNLFVIFGEPDIVIAGEEWLVDSTGKKVAPYDIVKLVSGIDSLAEINRLGSEDLQPITWLSSRREIWDYITDEAGKLFDSGKHSRGTGTTDDRGVSSVAWYCAGITGGTGNVFNSLREAGVLKSTGFRKLADQLWRDQQNAQRSHEKTLHSTLTTQHSYQIKIKGVDVFHPNTGEIRSDGADGIACWFIDTDYNNESFFVRHAYFLGANDPYKSLKTTLKAEINEEAWDTLHSDLSRPFDKPAQGSIAVKVINHLGDEVMKVFKI